MKRIDWLVLRSFIGPFILTFFICLLIFDLQFLWKYIDDLVGKGLEMSILAELMFYMSASVVPEVIPLAVLLASIMTFGALGENYELVALKSAGISLFRFMRPLFLVSILLTGVAFMFSNYVLPVSNLKFGTLLYSVMKAKPALNLKEGVFYDGIEGYTIKVDKKDEDNRNLEGVVIYNHTKSEINDNILTAERGEMYGTPDGNFLIFKLYNGAQHEELKQASGKRPTYEAQRTFFKEYEMVIDLESFEFEKSDEGFFKKNHKMMSAGQLRNAIDSMSNKYGGYDKKVEQQLFSYLTILKDTLEIPEDYRVEFMDSAYYANKAKKQRKGHVKREDSFSEFAYLLSLPKHQIERIARFASSKAKGAKNVANWSIKQKSYSRKKARKYHFTFFEKFAKSFACLLLFLIGAPLGAIIRKGGLGLPMVIAIIFFMIFYVLQTTGKKFAEETLLSPFTGSWMAIFILLPVAFFLVYKSANDSQLFNVDAYLGPFKALKKWFDGVMAGS